MAQTPLMRDIFGNPFKPPPRSPLVSVSVLNWNDRTIPRIARGIYEDRRLPAGAAEHGTPGRPR